VKHRYYEFLGSIRSQNLTEQAVDSSTRFWCDTATEVSMLCCCPGEEIAG